MYFPTNFFSRRGRGSGTQGVGEGERDTLEQGRGKRGRHEQLHDALGHCGG